MVSYSTAVLGRTCTGEKSIPLMKKHLEILSYSTAIYGRTCTSEEWIPPMKKLFLKQLALARNQFHQWRSVLFLSLPLRSLLHVGHLVTSKKPEITHSIDWNKREAWRYEKKTELSHSWNLAISPAKVNEARGNLDCCTCHIKINLKIKSKVNISINFMHSSSTKIMSRYVD